jgi:hypothetical protein
MRYAISHAPPACASPDLHQFVRTGARHDDKACRLAAEKGDARAQFSLGEMYDTGWGVPRDDAQAAQWYRKAVEQEIGATDSGR